MILVVKGELLTLLLIAGLIVLLLPPRTMENKDSYLRELVKGLKELKDFPKKLKVFLVRERFVLLDIYYDGELLVTSSPH